MTDEQIKQRMAGRKAADEFAALALAEISPLDVDGKFAFWECLAAKLAEYLPGQEKSSTQPEPMSDKAAAHFGRDEMRFGQYEGKRIDEVPLKYLAMLVDNNDWKRQLRRYLQSERVKQEMRDSSR